MVEQIGPEKASEAGFQPRVLVVAPSYYPDVQGGGERQVTLQAEQLASQGFKVTMLVPTLVKSNGGWSETPFGSVLRVPISALPAQGGRYLFSTIRWTVTIAQWLLRRRATFDLIYVFHGRLHVLGPLLGARLAKRPFVVKIGGGGTGSDFNALRRKKIFYGAWIAKALIKWTTKFVASSQTIADDLCAERIELSRIARVSNGVLVPEKAAIANALAQRSGGRMIFPTRLVDDKGIETLIEALALIPGSKNGLTLLGDGPDKARLKALAEVLGVRERVHFLDGVEDVYPHLLRHDIFLSASVREGQSNALLEAIACGLIPIVAPASGVADVIEHGTTGFIVESVDAPGFAREINHVLTFSPDERAAFAWRLHAHAKEFFAIEVVGTRLAAELRLIAEQAR